MGMRWFDDCIKSGLRVFDYGATVANVNGRAYYGLLNCYSFLIETRGIYLSKGVNFERRVFAQYTTVKSMLHYVKDHSDEITSNVARARDEVAKNGLHYSDDQLLVLQSAKSRTAGSGYTLHRPSFRFDGTYQDANQQNTFYYYDTAVRTRTAPTAYVIPIGETWAETVKKGLELSGAEIFTVSAGTTLSLQQYQQKTLGSDAEAKLTDTQEFTFPQGAYVIPMDQSCAMAIAMTLEPDVTDTTDGCSLVATKVLMADSDGNYPLYRCIQDSPRTALNLDGSGSGSSSSSSGSSGGSSTPAVKENYAITISDTTNGTVSSNVSKAAAGVTVTLTVKANSGYALDTLTVTDANGKAVTVSQNGGKYTFVMPAKAVTVKATFAAGTSSRKSFTDVPADHWACSPISWAAANGYMNGVSATVFQPNGTVTRQQLWMILARLSGTSPANMTEARTWAVANGISDGSNPSGAVTRQQLVAILYRYAQLMSYKTSGGTELTGYPDNTLVAGYAKDAMSWSVGNGIVAGTTDGKLNPTGTATRAQFAVILMRFTSKMA